MLAGLAGVLYARLFFYIEPNNFGFDTGLDALTYVVVGGSHIFLGSVLGAALLTALPELLRFLNNYRTVVNGLVLLGVILFLPGGLVDLPAVLWSIAQRLRRRGRIGRGLG
jgi:branched-chain amino acid transport system permease protein